MEKKQAKEKIIIRSLKHQIGRIIANEIVNCKRKVNHAEIIRLQAQLLTAIHGVEFTEDEVRPLYLDYVAGII
jgi:hypothetical protein